MALAVVRPKVMVLSLFIHCCLYCEWSFCVGCCVGVFSMQTFILMRKGEMVVLLCVLAVSVLCVTL